MAHTRDDVPTGQQLGPLSAAEGKKVQNEARALLESKGKLIMPTGTIRFHRVLRAPPERVYRAFLNADAMAKWLPPNGFTGRVHHLDAKVGGMFRMSFTNFTTDSVIGAALPNNASQGTRKS